MNEVTTKYLQDFLDTLPDHQKKKYNSFSADFFCADEKNANICAGLIKAGKKTASCSMKNYYTHTGEKLPHEGHLLVVTDWEGSPTSIVEIYDVTEVKFNDVNEDFARAEGEGDLSLDWWRKAHRQFFLNECSELQIDCEENMTLVLERFKVVYAK